jgi:hypothetical protein
MQDHEVADLARAIYPVVKKYAGPAKRSVSYSSLCEQLGGRWGGLDPRSLLLAAALGMIVTACRGAGLPALSALVVHAGSDRRPGDGYYKAAHPEIRDPLQQHVAWGKEFEAVHTAEYPDSLDDLLSAR